MSIRDELVGGTTLACKLCAFLARQSPADQAEWNEALALPVKVVSNTVVVAALKRRGEDLNETSVRRHRSNHVPR